MNDNLTPKLVIRFLRAICSDHLFDGIGFMKPVMIAIIIACPSGWWLMDLWLQSFPYRIAIEPWVFLVSGILVLLIAFVSVSSQTLKAAVTKPAETLKYE